MQDWLALRRMRMRRICLLAEKIIHKQLILGITEYTVRVVVYHRKLYLYILFVPGSVSRMQTPTPPPARRCVVVGAGAAGLSCASQLLAAGVHVLVLEASQRVGGRCRTEELADVGVVELGAQWFHGMDGNPAFELCSELGLLQPQTGAPKPKRAAKGGSLWLRSDGGSIDRHSVALARQVLQGAIEECEDGKAASASSVGAHVRAAWASARPRLLAEHCADAPLLDAAWTAAERFQCCVDDCADLAEQGVAAYANYDEFDDRTTASRPENGGFEAAMMNLAQPLLGIRALHFGCQVVAVDCRHAHASFTAADPVMVDEASHGVVVRCADGSEHRADAVCIAVPLEPLRRISFHPPLPDSQRAAMAAMGLGKVEKLYVTLERVASEASAAAGGADDGACGSPSDPDELTALHLLWVPPSPPPPHDGSAPAGGAEGGEAAREAAARASKAAGWPRGLSFLHALETPAAVPRPRAGRTTLVGWLTGSDANDVSGREPAELLPKLRDGLRPFWEQLPSWRPVACVATNWCADSHYGGAWSYPTVAATQDVASVLSAPVLAERAAAAHTTGGAKAGAAGAAGLEVGPEVESAVHGEPRREPLIVFAGEATSQSHFGTVGGAMESGTREAHRLLRAWRLMDE